MHTTRRKKLKIKQEEMMLTPKRRKALLIFLFISITIAVLVGVVYDASGIGRNYNVRLKQLSAKNFDGVDRRSGLKTPIKNKKLEELESLEESQIKTLEELESLEECPQPKLLFVQLRTLGTKLVQGLFYRGGSGLGWNIMQLGTTEAINNFVDMDMAQRTAFDYISGGYPFGFHVLLDCPVRYVVAFQPPTQSLTELLLSNQQIEYALTVNSKAPEDYDSLVVGGLGGENPMVRLVCGRLEDPLWASNNTRMAAMLHCAKQTLRKHIDTILILDGGSRVHVESAVMMRRQLGFSKDELLLYWREVGQNERRLKRTVAQDLASAVERASVLDTQLYEFALELHSQRAAAARAQDPVGFDEECRLLARSASGSTSTSGRGSSATGSGSLLSDSKQAQGSGVPDVGGTATSHGGRRLVQESESKKGGEKSALSKEELKQIELRKSVLSSVKSPVPLMDYFSRDRFSLDLAPLDSYVPGGPVDGAAAREVEDIVMSHPVEKLINPSDEPGYLLMFARSRKTATSTVADVLMSVLDSHRHTNLYHDEAITNFLHLCETCRSGFRYIHGHYQYGPHILQDRPARYVYNIRNPHDVVASYVPYMFHNRTLSITSSRKVPQNMQAEFACGFRMAHNGTEWPYNEDVRWRLVLECAKESLLRRIDVTIVAEDMDLGMVMLQRVLGFPGGAVEGYAIANVNPSKKVSKTTMEMSLYAEILDRNKHDVLLYLFARELLNFRYREIRDEVNSQVNEVRTTEHVAYCLRSRGSSC